MRKGRLPQVRLQLLLVEGQKVQDVSSVCLDPQRPEVVLKRSSSTLSLPL